MKRNNVIVNAKKFKTGKRVLKWGVTGMNWIDCSMRGKLMTLSRVMMTQPKLANEVGEWCRKLTDAGGYHPSFITQSAATAAILMVDGDRAMFDSMMEYFDNN